MIRLILEASGGRTQTFCIQAIRGHKSKYRKSRLGIESGMKIIFIGQIVIQFHIHERINNRHAKFTIKIMKKSLIGLLALSSFSLLSLPALADQANVQNSSQVNSQIGNNNNSSQQSRQFNRTSVRGRRENIGSAQDSFQDSFQEGNRNNGRQSIIQRNVIRRNRR